jgi:poly(3-hydroxybutyrate) depolymerase
VQRTDAAGCAGGTEVALVRIDGGGHIWPWAPDATGMTAQFFASR